MKKKIFLFLAILLCLGAALALTACGHTHTYGEWIETTAPTCTTRGIKTHVCDCGHSETQYVDLKDHIYSEWVETLAATCVAEGSHYKTCKTCSYKVTEEIPIDASKHIPASTWTTDGNNHWKVCTRTGCTAQVNKTAHTYDEWVETTAPTCVAEGSHYKTCKTCSYKVTEAIPIDASKHAPASTWTTDGTHHWKVCTRTGCDAQVNKTTHTYGEWVETLAATCVAEGSHYKTCKTCSDKVTEAIPINEENHAFSWKNDATNHWKVCTRTGCGAQLNKGAHTPAAWSSDATNHWKDCTACGYDVDPIAAHTYDAENTCVCGDYKDKGVQFTLSNGTYSVTDYTGTATEVVIPATYKGIAVTSIGEWAFSDCSKLTSITIPDSVTSIGEWAFSDCSKLTSITIPDSVTSIGACAFYICSQLTTVEFGANSKLTSIGECAFYNCDGLTTITIPDSVTSIGEYAFSSCSQLTTVTFGANSKLTSIGNVAFSYCSNLTTITIPDSVTSIGKYAFSDCSQLTTVYYGGSASDWGKITIGDYNSKLSSATRYYYSATQPTEAGNWWYYDQNGKPAVWP